MYDLNDIANTIICGHALDVLKQFPAESVSMAVTSPPYWGKRSYKTTPQVWDGDPHCDHDWTACIPRKLTGGTNGDVSFHKNDRLHITVESEFCAICGAWRGELGHEPTPELFISHLVQVFDEVKRVLRRDGTLWVNIGESYGGSKTGVHIGCSPTSSLLTKQVQEKAVAGWSDCGCSSGFEPGIVLDPFMGSGTTALVALRLGRRFIGIDTNPDYVKMAYERVKPFMEQKKIIGVQVAEGRESEQEA